MKRPTHAEHGFTLVEVMVSLAIMGLVATVAFAGLGIGIDTWSRGSAKIEELDGRARVERLLKRQLAVAYPLSFEAEWDESAFVMFRGTNAQVEFIADYSVNDGVAGFRKIGYRFDRGAFWYEEKKLMEYVPAENEMVEGDSLAEVPRGGFRYLRRNASEMWEWVGSPGTELEFAL